ncbi:hypothetical protein IC608_12330 [Devosia sp. PTR5]|jgi:hypothetical protein|uniref:Uncharacterized protein n=1 Tax=Devosia oryzisoli TaxID=2774138 RepID=A0A927ITU7_9HYPH|nr:hypothetical protein [Devosia oryzisoli]MBD8066257.1 hypothetical protein [Devosia oryzisoli]
MPIPLSTTTYARAERHEALWLRMTALHKAVTGLAGRRPEGKISEAVRVVAEGLLSDCTPFRVSGERLAVAAPDWAGLAVQLGQALAELDAFENRHAGWEPRLKCRAWRMKSGPVPVRRLRPEVTGEDHSYTPAEASELRRKLEARINAITKARV